MKKKHGKFIVIDGSDGSGKSTQVGLLIARLKKEGHKVELVDFPEYDSNFFGSFIGHCLSEQDYNWLHVHPKIASIVYAADRFESKAKIEKWLADGRIIVANRYVSANQIHQGGKIKNAKKRAEFMEWLAEMEYKVFKIPKPDFVLYLHMPLKLSLELIAKRDQTTARAYLKKKKDVHESDVDFLKNSRMSALWLSEREKNWKKIECSEKSQILTPEAVHEKVYSEILPIIKK